MSLANKGDKQHHQVCLIELVGWFVGCLVELVGLLVSCLIELVGWHAQKGAK